MSLSIVTAVCGGNSITGQFLEETVGRCGDAHQLVIVSNGSLPSEVDELRAMAPEGWDYVVHDEPEPMGSTAAFNRGVKLATGDIVALLHNDLMVREPHWDHKVLAWFSARPETGVAGFHGSRCLGRSDIYRTPYELVQLARSDNWSNLEDAESHGRRIATPIEVVTLDGMSLICRRQDFLAWGGLEEAYVHHMYDHDLCLTARAHGKRNYMLPLSARHLSGQTANMPRYNDHFAALGGDAGIHRLAHERFYAKWRGQLPACIR